MTLRHTAGSHTVWCLTDGARTFPADVFPEIDEATREARLTAAGLSGIDTAFGAYLIEHPDGSRDLVDTGYGDRIGPDAGHLSAELDALGVAPGDIRSLIFTHLHGDHCGGAVVAGTRVFDPERVYLHPAEIVHWQGRDGPAAETLAAYADRIVPVEGGSSLPGGLVTWALPGHTPGHMGLRIGGHFALVGDILHSQALQLPDPGLCPVYDSDPVRATATRRMALAELARSGIPFSGSHNIAPWIVHRVVAEGMGYRAVPA